MKISAKIFLYVLFYSLILFVIPYSIVGKLIVLNKRSRTEIENLDYKFNDMNNKENNILNKNFTIVSNHSNLIDSNSNKLVNKNLQLRTENTLKQDVTFHGIDD